MTQITIPEIYLSELEKSANSYHQQCQELEAIAVELNGTISDLKAQLKKFAERQRLEVMSHPEIAIAVLESYALIEQKKIDSAKRLQKVLKGSNSLGDRYSYSQRECSLKESRKRLAALRSLLDAVKEDAARRLTPVQIQPLIVPGCNSTHGITSTFDQALTSKPVAPSPNC